MQPIETWKKNKNRLDLRKYTREFQKKFTISTTKTTEVGIMYAINYRSSDCLTDKHHVTPVIISFGRFRDYNDNIYVRGLNLLFLSNSEIMEITTRVHMLLKYKADDRVPGIIKIHEEFIKRVPYAFKNFKESKISIVNKIDKEEWGMIPLLHRHLFGNFNIEALKKDYTTENTVPVKKVVKQKEKKKEKEIIDEEVESIEWNEGDIFDMEDEDYIKRKS
jgi:hypothetical protein